MLYDPKWEEKIEVDKDDESWRKVLRDAAMLIKKRGWCQRQLSDKKGRYCTVGAIREVGGSGLDERGLPSRQVREAYTRLIVQLKLDGIPWMACAAWNDNSKRTKAEVISALLAAANS